MEGEGDVVNFMNISFQFSIVNRGCITEGESLRSKWICTMVIIGGIHNPIVFIVMRRY